MIHTSDASFIYLFIYLLDIFFSASTSLDHVKGKKLSRESIFLFFFLSSRNPHLTVITVLVFYCFSEETGRERSSSPHTVQCVRSGDASRAHHRTTKPHRKTQCQKRAALAGELLSCSL